MGKIRMVYVQSTYGVGACVSDTYGVCIKIRLAYALKYVYVWRMH